MFSYNLKIIESGSRLEIYKIKDYAIVERGENNSTNKTGRRGKSELDKKTKEENTERARESNLNNTRNKIIRLIKSNADLITFITLTYKKEVDYKDSKKHLNNFFNKLRRKYKELKYIWVLEFGEINKRLHFHILTNIKIDINLVSSKRRKTKAHKELEKNFNAKFWGHGFVDIRNLKQENNTNIALYVTSYIVKALKDIDLKGYRIMGYSRKTLQKPKTYKFLDYRNTEELLKDFKDYKIRYTNSYEIGYEYKEKERRGLVTYFDMEGV